MEFLILEISHTSQLNIKCPQWGVPHPLKNTGFELHREHRISEIGSVSIFR
jgi:hypothetical protein